MCRRMRFIANSNIAMAEWQISSVHRERIQNTNNVEIQNSKNMDVLITTGCSWILFQSVTCTCSSWDHDTMLTMTRVIMCLSFCYGCQAWWGKSLLSRRSLSDLYQCCICLVQSLAPLLHNQILADTVECTLGELIMYITTYEKFHLNKRQVWAYFLRYALVICILCFHECK